jgi:type I restriction enzyme R subunit
LTNVLEEARPDGSTAFHPAFVATREMFKKLPEIKGQYRRKIGILITDGGLNCGDDPKLITESLQDFSKKTITSEFASIDDFLTRWKESERKDVIVSELLDRGVAFEELRKEIGKDLDVFDLILH